MAIPLSTKAAIRFDIICVSYLLLFFLYGNGNFRLDAVNSLDCVHFSLWESLSGKYDKYSVRYNPTFYELVNITYERSFI